MSDSDTVSIRSALFRDPRYWDLKPSQRAALPILIDLMQEYGQDGVLDLSRKAVCKAIGLRPGLYAELLGRMDGWRWGCETDEGRLVLCGVLVPAGHSGPWMDRDQDLQKMVAEAVAAALATAIPVALETAVPAIVKMHAAETKAQQRLANKQQGAPSDVQDKPASEAANVQDNEAENEGDVLDTEPLSRTRGESVESISIDSNKSYSSNDSIDSNRSIEEEQSAATLPPELVPADVAQRIVEKSPNPDKTGRIEMPRAQALLEKYGAERCLQVLLMIPVHKPGKPGAFIEAALLNKAGKYPASAEIVADAKRRLSPSVPKLAPQQTPPPAPKAPPSEEERAKARIWSFTQTMTPEEAQQIDAEAVQRMPEQFRGVYIRAIAEGRTPGSFARAEFDIAQSAVLREWALRGSDGPNASQGG